MRVWFVVAVVAIVAFAPGARLRAGQDPRATPFDTLYRSYADGNYNIVAKEIRTVADLNALNPPKPDELRKWLGAWDRTKAAYLLELAVAAGPLSRSAETALISEGRLYVISRTPALGTSPSDDEFEVLWHKTAIAQLEGIPYLQAEMLYLDTLDLRYTARRGEPKRTLDPRLVFQRAVAVEQYCWRAPEGIQGSLPPPPSTNTDNSVRIVGGQPLEIAPGIENKNSARFLSRKECLADGAKRYTAAAAAPANAPEAFTRAAWLKAQLGAYKDAIELIDRAPATDDKVVTYWHQLFRARILAGLNRDEEAEREYRAALATREFAQSANIGLALTLFKLDRVDDARALAAAIRQGPKDSVDPWWTYLGADARFVTTWVREVREKIRRQASEILPKALRWAPE